METGTSKRSRSESLLGVFYAGSAFLIRGLSPVYWKAIRGVPALEISLHRVIWYREPFSGAQTLTFVLIWTALIIYTTDSIHHFRQTALSHLDR